MSEPTLKAVKKCAEWLATCIKLGWGRECLDDLEKIWWKHHDEQGNLLKSVLK